MNLLRIAKSAAVLITPDSTVLDAASQMRDANVGAVAVVDDQRCFTNSSKI